MSPRVAEGEALRVAFYSGVYMRQDAISHSIRHKVDVLRRAEAQGHPVEWRVFVHGSDVPDVTVRQVSGVAELVEDSFFWDADVHVFEFGIHYPLFDAVFVIPPDRAVLGVYHNVTPRALVSGTATEVAVVRAEQQRMNLALADHVANDSEFNRDGLLALGFPEEGLSVLHLPPSVDVPATLGRSRRRPGPLRLLYVGRLVRSKGVLDLLVSLARLLDQGHDVRLTLVGNTEMSDPAVLAEVEGLLTEGLEERLSFLGNVDDVTLAELYQDVDALVMPSYHEGYCVPVVEAFAFGCFVVAYDAANLPNVVGEMGSLVQTGDVASLTTCLALLADRVATAERDGSDVVLPTVAGDVTRSEWLQRLRGYNARFDRRQFEQGFMRLLDRATSKRRLGSPDWLASAVACAEAGAS